VELEEVLEVVMVEEEEAMLLVEALVEEASVEEASVDLHQVTMDLAVTVAPAVFTLLVHITDMTANAMQTLEDLEERGFSCHGQFIGITTTITELYYVTIKCLITYGALSQDKNNCISLKA
jgi:hypothetical protein